MTDALDPDPRPVPDEEGAPRAAAEERQRLGQLGARAWSQARVAMSLVRFRPFETDTPHGRSQERYRRIALTTLSSLAVRGVGTLTGLVSVPLVLSYLGKERYGLWSTITTVVAWVALFDLGIANGLVNCISRAHGRDEHLEAGRYVSTAFALLLGVAALLALVVGVSVPLIPWSSVLAVRGAVDDATVRWSVAAALGMFIVGMPLSVVPQVFAGYQKSYVANAFALVGMLTGFAALLLAIHGGARMPALVIVFGVASVVSGLLGLVYAWTSMPWLRVRTSAISRDAARGLLSRSFPIFLFQIGALTVNETQSIILAHRCDLAVVADYSILMRLYILVIGLIQVSTASFVPSFREARERGDRAWVRAAFSHFVRVRTLLACAAGLGMILLGNSLLRFWLRRADIAFSPALWVAVAVMLVAATWVTAHSDLLSIMDRLWVLVVLVLFNGATTVVLTYWLAGKLQVFGVVLATSAVTAVVYTWLLPMLTRQLLESR